MPTAAWRTRPRRARARIRGATRRTRPRARDTRGAPRARRCTGSASPTRRTAPCVLQARGARRRAASASRALRGWAAPPPGLGEQVERRGAGAVGELRRRLEAVLHEQLQVVTLVEHLDLDLGVQLDEAARLAVLLRHQLLVERGDLDVEVVRREVEVGREGLRRVAFTIALEHEGARLVVPLDRVEVEELRELS